MKQLGGQIQRLRERYWDEEVQAAHGKDVVLVEGDDDRDVVETVLGQRRATWSTRIRVVVAGGRTRVLERAKTRFPDAHMLVDRDTWTDAEIRERQDPRLHVTSGWCLENLFLDPEFLGAFDPQLAAVLAPQRIRWVQAGALWWTLQRAREAQQHWQDTLVWTYGVPRDDLDLTTGDTVRAGLQHKIPPNIRDQARLDIDTLADGYTRRLQEVLALPEADQWRCSVHGKQAFRHLLVPALQAARGVQNWRVQLAALLRRQHPFDVLLALLLL